MRFAIRVAKGWFTAGLIALGAAAIFRGWRLSELDPGTALFGVGVFLVLASVPVLPWLCARPWYYDRRYWG